MNLHIAAAARALLPVHFGQRPPLYSPRFPFLLLWSHKAASTALAQWFFAHIGSPHLEGGDRDAIRRFAGLGIHAYQFDVHCRGAAYRLRCRYALAGALPVIKFVRDPAARAFSAFLATRRGVVRERPDFWGARVSCRVAAFKGMPESFGAYSFADFVEWMAATPAPRQNPHVRQQWMPFEAGRRIEYVPIEHLVSVLAELEHRFGLPAVSARAGIFHSGHHRPPPLPVDAETLDALLNEPVMPGRFDGASAPVVDSASLRTSALGERLRTVLAADYRACPQY